LTTTTTFPLVIAALANRQVYFQSPGTYTLSVQVNGVEGANPRSGTTATFDLSSGEVAAFNYAGLDYSDGTTWTTGITNRTVAALPSPVYGAHRCGAQIFPEQTIEAAEGAAALTGVDVIDWDVNLMADGVLAMMHDDTVDRTTTGTGNVSAFIAPQFKTLQCDAGSWFAPAWPNTLRVPLLGEVLDRFGGKKVLSIEPKTTSCVAPLIAEVTRRGLGASVLLNTQILSDIATIKAAGIAAHFYYPTSSITTTALATVVAAAPNAIWINPATVNADVTTVVATGIPVWAYSVSRQSDVARMRALGVVGFLLDEPLYGQNKHKVSTTDNWVAKTYDHGLIDTLGTRPTFTGTNVLTFGGNNLQYATVGSVSPIANAASTYHIDIDLGFSTLPTDTTRWVGVMFAASDDSFFNSTLNTPSGYHVILRANGNLQMFIETANTQLGSTITTTALSAGAFAHLRIDVTPTSLTVTRTDSGGFTPISSADATNRGAWLHIGKSSTDGIATFRALAVT
jgi:glycerophosphoryl diester phosphodiesterase